MFIFSKMFQFINIFFSGYLFFILICVLLKTDTIYTNIISKTAQSDNMIQSDKGQNQVSIIDEFIANQEKKYNAVENKNARKIIWSDVNNDGVEDAFTFYTLENLGGSTLYTDNLAVFLGNQKGQLKYITRKIIGGKNRRAILEAKVNKGRIRINTLEYTLNDARCCPSKEGNIEFVFIKNRLNRIK